MLCWTHIGLGARNDHDRQQPTITRATRINYIKTILCNKSCFITTWAVKYYILKYIHIGIILIQCLQFYKSYLNQHCCRLKESCYKKIKN